MASQIQYMWLRRDLRLFDNRALFEALSQHSSVQLIFIFDQNILSELSSQRDSRVDFILQSLQKIQKTIASFGSSIRTEFGNPVHIWKKIIEEESPSHIYSNQDWEPYGKNRDQQIKLICQEQQVSFLQFKDHVIKAPGEVLKDDGNPYTVFTPFKKKYLGQLSEDEFAYFSSEQKLDQLSTSNYKLVSLQEIGFKPCQVEFPNTEISDWTFEHYSDSRNLPAEKNGVSRLGVHLRFGTISTRKLAKTARDKGSDTFLSELIWREFFIQILHFFPHSAHSSFRKKYDLIPWRNNEAEFEAWKKGETGYPFVDAGMRELNATGYMHNRVRMVVASFLCKHLLIDWRWGEAYFAEKLLDFELASNVGNWQWAAGSGCDAAPYFRVFNPETQLKKFDPNLEYTRRWVPEIDSLTYGNNPIVEHKFARERAISTYKEALQ